MNHLPSAATEDYLKAVLESANLTGKTIVPMGKLAERLKVTPGTVSVMVKRLAADGLINYQARIGCSLTEKGRIIALRTIRRHRVLETFLVETLGMDWSSVHEEAERMEHGTSDEVIDRLWEFLGSPLTDPHGSRIPDKELNMLQGGKDVRLSEMADNSEGILSRMSDRSPGLLTVLQEKNLIPGTAFRLTRQDEAGTVCLESGGRVLTLAAEVASSLWACLK